MTRSRMSLAYSSSVGGDGGELSSMRATGVHGPGARMCAGGGSFPGTGGAQGCSCASLRPQHSGSLPSSCSCASLRPQHSGSLPSSWRGATIGVSLGSALERCQYSVSAARRTARWRLCILGRNPSSHEPPPFHIGTLAPWIEVARYESDVDSGGPAVMECPSSGGSLDR